VTDYRRGGIRAACLTFVAAAALIAACDAGGATPAIPEPDPVVPAPPTADVDFTIDTRQRHAISPYIYGMNFAERGGSPAGVSPWNGATLPTGVTLNRFGGNRLTAFNWETGWSNVGSDGGFSNDARFVSDGASYNYGTAIGSAVAGRWDASFARGQGILLTVPILGYVAGDASGTRLTITDADRDARLAAHFKVSRPAKGAAFTLTPSTTDGFVYQDEFVNWVNTRWPNRGQDVQRPIFFSLDNEPDLWPSTHEEIQSDSSDNPDRPRLYTYDQLADAAIQYSRAVKSVMPDAVVFGPALATYTGIVSGGRYTNRWHNDPVYGQQNFVDVYLDRLKRAETTEGRRLLDVLDVHYYPAAGDGQGTIVNDRAAQSDSMVNARLQAARSLWDPTYTEGSWVNSVTGGPIQLLPRLKGQIAAHYPGTRLAVTEYFFGRAGDISGGLVQADVLGVFGREEVFAATIWPYASVSASPYNGDGARAYAYAFGAFNLFLDADGAGTRFGSSGVRATTSDVPRSSVYASLDDQGRVMIVAINKRRTASAVAGIAITDPRVLARVVSVRRMMDGVPAPAAIATTEVTPAGANAFRYTMPPMSATTIVLAP
jgi:Glycoside hydrolase family 44